MKNQKIVSLTSPDQVPKDMTEDEAHEFWSTHGITEEYLAAAGPVSDDDLPPVRSEHPRKYVAVHLPRAVFQRAREIARQRGMTVSDLFDELLSRETGAEESKLRTAGS